MSSDDRVSSVIPLDESIKDDEYLVLLTQKGFIKKTPLKAFQKLTSRGLISIALEESDRLGWARRCTDVNDVIISTRKVRCTMAPEAGRRGGRWVTLTATLILAR